MSSDAATARKAAARRKTMLAARDEGLLPPHLERMAQEMIDAGYGVDGPMRGSQRHKVKSVSEILERMRARAASAAQLEVSDAA